MGWLEKSFFDSHYPKEVITKKELMDWIFDFIDEPTNYNKIYAIRRAITRFLTQQDNRAFFFIDWVKMGKKNLSVKQAIEEFEEKQKQKEGVKK